MTLKRRHLAGASAAAETLTGSAAAGAQRSLSSAALAAGSALVGFSEVIMRARKRRGTLPSAPVAIIAFSALQLTGRHITRPLDFANTMPSIDGIRWDIPWCVIRGQGPANNATSGLQTCASNVAHTHGSLRTMGAHWRHSFDAARQCLISGALLLALTSAPAVAQEAERGTVAPAQPSTLYPGLFGDVAMAQVFTDGKAWADMKGLQPPPIIMQAYRDQAPKGATALSAFVSAHFSAEPRPATSTLTTGLDLTAHIHELWPILTRDSHSAAASSSLLPLPHPFVVPGGRFTELYYWDSYFTMLGLDGDRTPLRDGMVANFADMIDHFGHIPNGTRTYYLSRSQPPFFFKMVALQDASHPERAFARYLPELKREYGWWMRGSAGLRPGAAHANAVAMPDGSILNRYWDDQNTPRDESYALDVNLAQASAQAAPLVFRNIRAAAESGWDFSSRWFADGKTLETIQTTAIAPVDLNSLLYGIEQAIAAGCRAERDFDCERTFMRAGRNRRRAMQTYLWNETSGAFFDYQWVKRRQTGILSAATLYPLFVGLATQHEADRVAQVINQTLVKAGGLATTVKVTGQQWDAPNGWAPLQWIAVQGLRHYGQGDAAKTIASRWLGAVSRVYGTTGKVLEKYDVEASTPGGGGEYPLQDGFGWTNGVTIGLLKLYPNALASSEGLK